MVTIEEMDTAEPASEDRDVAARPGRPGQRLAVSTLIVFILLGVFASNAPDSTIKDGLLGLTRPLLLVTGLDQRWGVFAPNPRLETSDVAALIDRADGTVGVHALDSGDGLSEYWNYRWRKYGEQLWTKPSADQERTAFSTWVAEMDRAAGNRPVRVTLVRFTRPNLPPGPGPDTGPWREVPFFTMPVSSR